MPQEILENIKQTDTFGNKTMESICDLLQRSTVDKTVRTIIRLDDEEFRLAIMQFLINCLKRNFVLESDDLKSIDGNLVMLVYRSVRILICQSKHV